jgi:predicted  nucleic acid-binding Zn-ribbon protein
MSKLTDDLFALQTLLRLGAAATAEQREQLEALRSQIPAPMVSHVARQIAAGRRGIAYVRNGVCGECHLWLPHAMVYVLARTNEVLVCESCGTFVTPASESRVTPPVALPKVRRVRRAPEPVA